MSSTLCMRVTPKPLDKKTWHFKMPVKAIFARRFYDHDGTLGGGCLTITVNDLSWLEGVMDAGNFDSSEMRDLKSIADALREGETVDMWFEV